MKLSCHACGRPDLSPSEHPGIYTNRRASLRGQIHGLREQRARLMPLAASMRKESELARKALAAIELLATHHEVELAMLGGIES